jgi:hypothetical protein
MGIPDFALAAGHPAHLVIHPHRDLLEVLRFHQAPTHVISHGQLVAPAP